MVAEVCIDEVVLVVYVGLLCEHRCGVGEPIGVLEFACLDAAGIAVGFFVTSVVAALSFQPSRSEQGDQQIETNKSESNDIDCSSFFLDAPRIV